LGILEAKAIVSVCLLKPFFRFVVFHRTSGGKILL
jgi:hypothetical protein